MSEPKEFKRSNRSTLRRFAFRGQYDRKIAYAILDASILCHVGYEIDGQPFVTPTACWRNGDYLYWHGGAEGTMLKAIGEGGPVCVTVSHLDGLVLSRVLSRTTFNYRSVMIFGTARTVEGRGKKRSEMKTFVDRMLPGRWEDTTIKPTNIDIDRVTIMELKLDEVVTKIRSGPPSDNSILQSSSNVWAGYIPVKMALGKSVPDPNLKSNIVEPGYLRKLASQHGFENMGHEEFKIPEFSPTSNKPHVNDTDGQSNHWFEIQIEDRKPFRAPSGMTILEAALQSENSLPFQCASGGCGACKMHLKKGTVKMGVYEKLALPDKDKSQNLILTCSSYPTSNCVLVRRPK